MSRIQALVQLRNIIFKDSLKHSTTGTAFARTSQAQKLTTYYPPDISVLRLSRQDPSLKDLKLRDEWLDTQLDREIMLQKRKKNVRVSVLLGKQKKPVDAGGKKKKRK